MCDRTEPWAYGTLVRAGAHPGFWEYNAVRVEQPAPLTAGELIALADDWLGDLHHRRIEVEDPETGARLRPRFADLGWMADALVWMVSTAPPGPAPASAEEGSLEEARPLHRAWLAEERIELPEHELRSFLDDDAAIAAARGSRTLVVRDGGRPVAYARWTVSGDTGEIEDVYCSPERRGEGLGTALVTAAHAAATAAGARTVVIGADAEGRPRALYERLGFRPAWIQHAFWRA